MLIFNSHRPRDAWKYANLYRNALSVVEANSSSGVANNTVLIVAPSKWSKQFAILDYYSKC